MKKNVHKCKFSKKIGELVLPQIPLKEVLVNVDTVCAYSVTYTHAGTGIGLN